MKTNLTLSLLFLVLLVPTGIKFFASQNVAVDMEDVPRLFDGFSPENVAFIELSRPKKAEGPDTAGKEPEVESIAMRKQDDEWILAAGTQFVGLRAKSAEVESKVLDVCKRILLTDDTVIDPDASDERLEAFGLDERSALKVVCGDRHGQPIAELLVGRAAGGTQLGQEAVTGQYVRRPDQKIVVLHDEAISLGLSDDDWLDKTVQDIDESEITKLTLSNKHGTTVFTRKEGKDGTGWKPASTPEGVGKLREYEVVSLVGSARKVDANEFVAPAEKRLFAGYGLEPPRIEVTIETKDGKLHALRIGKRVEGKQDYHAVLSEGKTIFTISDWAVTSFEKAAKDFFDEPEKEPEKEPGEATKPPEEATKPPEEATKPPEEEPKPPEEEPKPGEGEKPGKAAGDSAGAKQPSQTSPASQPAGGKGKTGAGSGT